MSNRMCQRDWVGPSVFIVVGLLLLLNNLGYISWSIWGQMAKYWPVLLIVGGLVLILGGGSRGTGHYFVGLAILAGVLWMLSGAFQNGWDLRAVGSGTTATKQHFTVQTVGEENNAQSVELSMSFKHARVKLESSDHPITAEMRSVIMDGSGKPKFDRNWQDRELQIQYRQKYDWTNPGSGWFGARYNKYHIGLGRPGVPYRIKLDIGSGKAEIDLGPILLQNGYFSVGSGKIEGDFSEETPVSDGPLTLEVGSGEIDFEGLGYLGASNIAVTVGSGSATLGFKGMGSPKVSRLKVAVGSGHTVIRLPRDSRWNLKGTVGSGNVLWNGESLGHGTIQTSNQEGKAGSGLEIELNVGSGTVELVSE